MPDPSEYDLIIVGGGLVGASLAVTLQESGLSIAVVERWPLADDHQPSYDERTVALTWCARCVFTGMGVWPDIAPDAEPIRDIHISNRGRFGMVHLSHHHSRTPALGYVVPTRVIGRVLMSALHACDGITLLCPAEACGLHQTGQKQVLTLIRDGATDRISAPLVVVADGGRSSLLSGNQLTRTTYPQHALLSIVTTDRAHRGRAWERFTEEGPLALLPLSENRLAVVWTSMPDELPRREALDDDGFLHHLQSAFGNRAGNFRDPSARKAYPLHRSHLRQPAHHRKVVLGNAAHMVHPVAGQGFNLGLRDVAVLAELVFHAHRNGLDIGSESLLAQYNSYRQRDSLMVRHFTHSLVTLFTTGFPGIAWLRNLGMVGLELFPPAKRFLLHRTMGLHAPTGVLGMGLPLHHPSQHYRNPNP